MSIQPQILIVDDELGMVRSLEILLREKGRVLKAYSVPEAEEVLNTSLDCIITDVSMPEGSGLDLIEKSIEKAPQTPVIVMTAYSSVPQAVDAMQRGAFEYIVKPFENDELLQCVERAIHRKGLRQGVTSNVPGGWVCNSSAMKEFVEKATRLASNLSTALIVGEKGVGKKSTARWLHDQACPVSSEFIVVDARSHEEDSPLWRDDMWESHGSLYIPQIFSLPPRLQDRLAELKERKQWKILASSSSPPELQEQGSFRKDLLEALRFNVIRVPSLNERHEDLEALCRSFLSELQREFDFDALTLDTHAMEALKNHNFVGNVKELKRILERAVLESRSSVITAKHLHFEPFELALSLPFSIPIEQGWGRLKFFTKALEKDLILRTLQKYPHSSNTQIASILGTTRRILELRLKEYQIRDN